jgi:hypothetical protein
MGKMGKTGKTGKTGKMGKMGKMGKFLFFFSCFFLCNKNNSVQLKEGSKQFHSLLKATRTWPASLSRGW